MNSRVYSTVTFALTCETQSRYCIEYSNGTLHDVWTFESIALVSVVVAIGGYLRASKLHKSENNGSRQDDAHTRPESDVGIGGRNDNGVST